MLRHEIVNIVVRSSNRELLSLSLPTKSGEATDERDRELVEVAGLERRFHIAREVEHASVGQRIGMVEIGVVQDGADVLQVDCAPASAHASLTEQANAPKEHRTAEHTAFKRSSNNSLAAATIEKTKSI